METTKEEILKVELKGDECKDFASALKKVVAEERVIGFTRSSLTEAERKVMKDLSEKL